MSYYRQLFPPVVNASAGAYDGKQIYKFYFQISISNSRDQVQHAQLAAHYLDSNENALDTNTYPLGLVFYDNEAIKYDENVKMHYVELPAELLDLDRYYKVQMRLGAQSIEGVNLNYSWLNDPNEVNKMSEWSNVCIIKPINIPEFDIVNFFSKDNEGNYYQPSTESGNFINIAQSPSYEFFGSYYTTDRKGEETLKTYSFTLYEDNGTTVESSWKKLEESGDRFLKQYEKMNINYTFDHILENNTYYYVKFRIVTKNGYEDFKIYKIKAVYSDLTLNGLTFDVIAIPDAAKVSLNVRGSIGSLGMADGFYIRRTSIRTGFKVWKDLATYKFSGKGEFTFNYDDPFVEAGVMYKYTIQPFLAERRGVYVNTTDMLMDYDFAWLIGSNKRQVMMAYGTQISNFTKTVRESSIETIGSKYPYISRNANVGYRTFQLNTTITHYMDVEGSLINGNIFLNEGEHDSNYDTKNDYEKFYKAHGITENNNHIIEREFRNKLFDFLYEEKPKLFKSDMEGLMLVKFSNVNLTPKLELGRMIYDLSCTVTEVGDTDFETLEKYGIKEGV